MARVRSGQAPAWPLPSDRSARRGSGIKRDLACTFTRHFPPVLVVLRSQSRLRLEGRTRTLSGPSPDPSPAWGPLAFAPSARFRERRERAEATAPRRLSDPCKVTQQGQPLGGKMSKNTYQTETGNVSVTREGITVPKTAGGTFERAGRWASLLGQTRFIPRAEVYREVIQGTGTLCEVYPIRRCGTIKRWPVHERIELPHLIHRTGHHVHHTTGFDREEIIDLCIRINSVQPGAGSPNWPPCLGLFKSVVAALTSRSRR